MKDALGHGSNAHNSGIAKLSAAQFNQLVAKAKADSARTDQVAAEVRAAGDGLFEHPSGRVMAVTGSFEKADGLRATSFSETGEALGHREYPAHDDLGLRSEISMALSGGYKYKGRV